MDETLNDRLRKLNISISDDESVAAKKAKTSTTATFRSDAAKSDVGETASASTALVFCFRNSWAIFIF
jgi:hypothetical protein